MYRNYTVTAAVTADVILKEDLQTSKSIADSYAAYSKYSQLEMRLYSLILIDYLIYFGLDKWIFKFW